MRLLARVEDFDWSIPAAQADEVLETLRIQEAGAAEGMKPLPDIPVAVLTTMKSDQARSSSMARRAAIRPGGRCTTSRCWWWTRFGSCGRASAGAMQVRNAGCSG